MFKILHNILIKHPRTCSLRLISYMDTSVENTGKKKPKYDGRSKKRQWQDRRSENLSSDIKKTKVDSDECPISGGEVLERIKRRKYAMLLGYCGVDFFGMQRNPKMQTIEEELLNALYKTNHITQSAYEVVQNMQFQRAARTDKGVSAVRQVVSLKLPEKVDMDAINQKLPEVVRVFGVQKVTKGFNSKTNCDGRTYSYTLPTVAFADKEAIVDQNGFRLDDETFERVNEVLGMFVGTKNFHNFTSKKCSQDPSAKRYIKSFVCQRPFLRNDVEFAVLKVQGQSFMLHQIRKMVALMLAVVRKHTNEAIFQQAFSLDRVNVPRAPGLGLLLEFVHYDRYNFRYGEDGIHAKLNWEEQEEEVENFKNKYILPVIINKEIEEKGMVIWLSKLRHHKYDDIDTNNDEEEEDEVEDDEEVDEKKEEESEVLQKSESVS